MKQTKNASQLHSRMAREFNRVYQNLVHQHHLILNQFGLLLFQMSLQRVYLKITKATPFLLHPSHPLHLPVSAFFLLLRLLLSAARWLLQHSQRHFLISLQFRSFATAALKAVCVLITEQSMACSMLRAMKVKKSFSREKKVEEKRKS